MTMPSSQSPSLLKIIISKMKETKIEGIGFLNNPCERCNNGENLRCSEPCKKYKDTGHDHYCPDCCREHKIYPETVLIPHDNGEKK